MGGAKTLVGIEQKPNIYTIAGLTKYALREGIIILENGL